MTWHSRISILILALTLSLASGAVAETQGDFPSLSYGCQSQTIHFCLIGLAKMLAEATPPYRIVLEEYVSRPMFWGVVPGGKENGKDPSLGIYDPLSLTWTNQPVPAILDSMVEADGHFEWIYDETSRAFFVVDKLLLVSPAWVMNATVPSSVVLEDVTLGEALEAVGTATQVGVPPAEDTDSFGLRTIDHVLIEKDTSFRFAVGRIVQHATPERTHSYETYFTPRQKKRSPFTAEVMEKVEWHFVPVWHPMEGVERPEDLEFRWSEE